MGIALSIVMLSWRAHATLRHTLESWRRSGLADAAEDVFVYFNDRTPADDALAAEFSVAAKGSSSNLGIWGGMDAMAKEAFGEYLLFLQNDHVVVSSPGDTRKWISGGLDLLQRNVADIVLLWNRFERAPGWGTSHYFDYHFVRELEPRAEGCVKLFPARWNEDTPWRRLHRLLRPDAARRHMNLGPYLERAPERVFPRYVKRHGDFFLLDSAIQPFTESPFMISRNLYEELSDWCRHHSRHRKVNGAPVMEHALNGDWWRTRHFRIAICDGGVFGHRRVDDSWRRDSANYNRGLSTADGRNEP